MAGALYFDIPAIPPANAIFPDRRLVRVDVDMEESAYSVLGTTKLILHHLRHLVSNGVMCPVVAAKKLLSQLLLLYNLTRAR